MEPIINPWLFYLINVVDRVGVVSTILLIISIVAFAIIGFTTLWALSDNSLEKHEKQVCFNYLKTALKVIIPCATILIFTPSSDTIYKMIIADNVTPHNIEIVGDTVESGIDYIFEKISSLTLEEEVKE